MNPQYYGAAAEYNKPSGGFRINKRLLVVLGLAIGAILLISIAFSIIGGLSKGPQEDFSTFISRGNALQELMQKQQASIRNTDLKTINAQTNILLLSDANTLTAAYTTQFGEANVPKDGFKPEADTTSDTLLKNATASGNFDHTYVTLLREKLASAYHQGQKVANTLSDGAVKTAVETAVANLALLDDKLVALGL